VGVCVKRIGKPQTRATFALIGNYEDLKRWPPLKKAKSLENSKRYLTLFETLGRKLPIKRIIVGPGRTQLQDAEFAKALVGNLVPVAISETPFIG
jgi:hypothetical protein